MTTVAITIILFYASVVLFLVIRSIARSFDKRREEKDMQRIVENYNQDEDHHFI